LVGIVLIVALKHIKKYKEIAYFFIALWCIPKTTKQPAHGRKKASRRLAARAATPPKARK
jgi:hypothetical protein